MDGTEPNLDPPRRYEDFARWQRETFRPGHPAYGDGLLLVDRSRPRGDLPGSSRLPARAAGLRPRRAVASRRSPSSSWAHAAWPVQCAAPAADHLSLQRAETVSELDPAEGMLTVNLAPETSRRLTELGRNVGASHFAIRLAAYAGLIAAETGSESVAFGTHFGTRSRAIARDVIGFCANHAMLLLRCDRTLTFRQFATALRDHVRAVQSHGDFPYEILHREMRAWRIRLPRVQALTSAGTTQPDTDFAGIRLITCHEDVPPAMPGGFEMKFNRPRRQRRRAGGTL